MAKFLLLCRKSHSAAPLLNQENASYISSQIIPDNITPNAPEIVQVDSGLEYAIFNPVSIITRQPGAICMGAGFPERGKSWMQPGDPKPYGSFALSRFNATQLELVADMVASQTIWYYHDENLFLASTSQRAILYFLEGFQLNTDVLPWMLSNGTLGPGFSWDKRLQCVPPDATVTLNRETWKLETVENPIKLQITEGTRAFHKNQTDEVLEEIVGNMDFPEDKWVLSLSGGYDSRALLLYLKNRRKTRCVTWGLTSYLKHHLSDAYVAKSLTEHFNLPFRFFSLDNSQVSFHELFRRFLIASEGRTDHIAGYSDGLDLWKQLFESGIEGMLRADQVYETKNILSVEETIKVNGIVSLDQYSNTKIFKKFGLGTLTWPEGLWLKQGESLIDWSARLYHNFRLPYLQAPLNAIKTCYVEMASPFLSRPIVNNAYSLPDELRFKKRLFRDIVESKTPDIPFATFNASHKLTDLVSTKEATEFLKAELKNGLGRNVLPDAIIQFLIDKLRPANSDLKKKSEKKKLLETIKQLIGTKTPLGMSKKKNKNTINLNLVAFRAVISLRAIELLSMDRIKTTSFAQKN
ncbi:MAG: hypothetical protein R3D00_16025 [Bacteroidia bacterium]